MSAADFALARDRMRASLRRGEIRTATDMAGLIDDFFGDQFSEDGRLDELAGYLEAAMEYAADGVGYP